MLELFIAPLANNAVVSPWVEDQTCGDSDSFCERFCAEQAKDLGD
jgi:hypothetical protein